MAVAVPSLVEPIPPNAPKQEWDEQKWKWLISQLEIIQAKLDELDARVAALEP